MVRSSHLPQKIKTTISAEKVSVAVTDMASYIQRQFDLKSGNVVLIGIQTRGYILAQRIAAIIEKKSSTTIELGSIDITLYRDDVRTSSMKSLVKETAINFPIDNKTVILIDDVLFTGRTIRAALDEIMDFGRPESIHLVVLIDRGHRELPIAAEFAALKVETSVHESVNLRLKEIDNEEDILIAEALS